MKKALTLILFLAVSIANSQTVGVMQYDVPNTDGYVLFSPINSTQTYLIDKCGLKVQEWTSTYKPGQACYLLGDGNLLRTGNSSNSTFTAGGTGGIIEKYDWNGNLIWNYKISDTEQCQHHDAIQLPNGNIVAIVWDKRTETDAVNNGKDPSDVSNYIWSEKLVELKPTGTNTAEIVWEWKVWDHLIQDYDIAKSNYGVVADHPELININYFTGPPNGQDWLHFNALDYNPDLDQIILSSHNNNEVWIIDHSTTTTEAASHSDGNSGKGGDLLYRWGNPIAYDRGTTDDKQLFGQHNVQFIPDGVPNAGKVIIFNNGSGRPDGAYSSIDIIETPVDVSGNYSINGSSSYEPAAAYWSYTAPVKSDFYGQNISGVNALSNGSFVICNGPNGNFFEINENEIQVWEYENPVGINGITSQGSNPFNNLVFRCEFYEPDYSAFNGLVLTPGVEIELNPTDPSKCELVNVNEVNAENNIQVFPNPVTDYLNIVLPESLSNEYESEVFNSMGQKVLAATNSMVLNMSELSNGIYFLKVRSGNNFYSHKIVKA